MEIEIYVDGGNSRNGSPNSEAYGSFLVLKDGAEVRHSAFELPEIKTSNQAEYASLLKLLEYLRVVSAATPESLKNTPIRVYTDSNLMVTQLDGSSKINKAPLKKLAEQVRDSLKLVSFPIELVWIGGDVVKEKLGH